MPAGDIGRITLAVSIVGGLSVPLTRGEAMLRFVQRALDAVPGPAPYWRHASDLRSTVAGRSASTLDAVAAVAKRADRAIASTFERIVDRASATDAVLRRMAGAFLSLHSGRAILLQMGNKLDEAARASFGLLRASGSDVTAMSATAKAMVASIAEAAARATVSMRAMSAADVAGLGRDGSKTVRRLAGIGAKRDYLRRAGSNGAAMLFRESLLTGVGHPFSPDTGAGSIGRSAVSGGLISPVESDRAMGMFAAISRPGLAAGTIARASAVVQKALLLIRGAAWPGAAGELRNSHSSLDGNTETPLLMLRGSGDGQNGSNIAKAFGRRAVVEGTLGKITPTTSSVAPPTTAVATMRLDHERFGTALLAHVVRPARPLYESSNFTSVPRKGSEFRLGTDPFDGRTTAAALSKSISGRAAPSQLRGFEEALRMSSVADAGRARKHLPKEVVELIEGKLGLGIAELIGWKWNALFRAAREWPGAVTGATPAQAMTELPAIGQRLHTEGQTSSLSSSRAWPSLGLAHMAASLRPIADAFDALVAIASRLRHGPAFPSIDGSATRGDGVRPLPLRVAQQLNLLQGSISTHGSAREAPVHVTVNAPLTVNGDIVEQAGLLTILDTWWRQKEPAIVNAVERARRQAAHTAARGSMADAGDASSRLNGFAMTLGPVQ